MKKFISKAFLFSAIIIVSYFFLGFKANGYTDPFYLRFTSPKQKSLIIGSSRAAQGICPSVLNSYLDAEVLKYPIYNFGFTILHSPYGEVYYKAIKGKLDKSIKNGLFILEVNPWSISSRTDLDHLRETKKELAKLTFYNMNPNYDYLRNAYSKSMFSLLLQDEDTNSMNLNDDGWLEVNISMDKLSLEKRTNSKIKTYKEENFPNYKLSDYRLNWLEKTINLLKNYGKVVLVRVPIANEILDIENDLNPDFDSIIKKRFSKIEYINYKDQNDYGYIDGNHLYKESSKAFSKQMAEDINKLISID